MTILGIIPARGGSKGIPRKNIKMLCGHPLIAWTIRAAQKSSLLDRFIVSTEDAEIAETARRYGAEVLDRPPELAGDEVISRAVIRHALEATGARVSVLLQPTSPIRNQDLIDSCLRVFLDGDYDSLATGYMNPVYPPHGEEHRRQDIRDVFVNDGSVVISTRETIMDGSLFGKKAGTLVTDPEQNIDIDREFDFWLAERVLEKRILLSTEYQQQERDHQCLERHLMAIHLLKAVEEEIGPGRAGRIARRAFRSYTDEVCGNMFDGPDDSDCNKKFPQLMNQAADSNPNLKISSKNESHIETTALECTMEKIYRRYGLSRYFQLFCQEDNNVLLMIDQEGRLIRPETIPTNGRAGHHL